MANELTASASVSFTKSPVAQVSMAESAKQFTVSGGKYVRQAVSIPTTAGGTAIDKGGVSTCGWLYVKNTDATNYVELMTATSGTAFAKLKPGEFALFRLTTASNVPAALANVSAVVIEYLLIED